MTKWSSPSSPSLWIATYLPSASHGETCLDVACGAGRHLQLAISRGYAATGIDRIATFPTDLVTAPGVKLLTWDLENGNPWPLRNQQFQAVIVTNYLYRPLLPTIVDSVAPDGILI